MRSGLKDLATRRVDAPEVALAAVTEAADAYLGGWPTVGHRPTLADVHEVLQALGDPRQAGVLALAHVELARMAEAIADPALRETFLGSSRLRLAVQRAWRRQPGNAAPPAVMNVAGAG